MTTTVGETAEKPQSSAARIIARNTIFVTAAQLALRVLGLLFSILVIRRLGDTEYGQYSVVLAWAGIFSFIGDLGIAQYMTREIARDKAKVGELFWDVTALRFVLAIFAAVVTTVGAVANGYDSRTVLAIGIYTSSYFLQAILAPLAGLIAGYERLDIVSVFQVIGQVIFLVFGGLFLFAGLDFVWLVIASLINIPVMIILCVMVIRRQKFMPPRFHIKTSTWWALIKFGLPFAFIQLTLTSAYQFDRLILEKHFSEQYIGWYSAAYTLTRAFLVLTAAFSTSLVLTLAREHARNPEVVRPWYYRSVKFVVFLGLPLAVGGTILADRIIRLAYGGAYAPTAIAFAILMWDTPLLMYTSLGGNITTSIQKERKAAVIYACEAAFNIVTNLILIPQYGVVAAAFTTVFTELVGVIMFYLLFRREFGAGVGLNHMLRLALSALGMGVVVYVLRDFNLVISVAAGMATYIGLVWLTRALNADERALVLRVFQRIIGRLGAMVGRLRRRGASA